MRRLEPKNTKNGSIATNMEETDFERYTATPLAELNKSFEASKMENQE